MASSPSRERPDVGEPDLERGSADLAAVMPFDDRVVAGIDETVELDTQLLVKPGQRQEELHDLVRPTIGTAGGKLVRGVPLDALLEDRNDSEPALKPDQTDLSVVASNVVTCVGRVPREAVSWKSVNFAHGPRPCP
jgi:hypothetical protein